MSTLGSHCSDRPAVSHDYQPKGEYVEIGGVKCYSTLKSAHEDNVAVTKGIVALYDAYGFKSQTLQGADLVAQLTGAVVLMPDFLGDSALEKEIVTHTEETKKQIADILSGPGKIENIVNVARRVCEAAIEAQPKIDSFGIYGLCLGGKAALVACQGDLDNQGGSLFAAVAQAHPAMLLAEDVQMCRVPILSLMSQKDGEPEAEKEFRQALKANKQAEFGVYANMPHGWMGAKGLNGGEESAKEFERGYQNFGAFFSKHLG